MEAVIASHRDHYHSNNNRKKSRRAKWSDGKSYSPALERLDMSLPSPITRKNYPAKLGPFFETAGLSGSVEEQAEAYMQMAKENGPEWVKQTISDHIRKLMQRYYYKEVRPGTVKNHVSNLKSFFVANEDEKELEGIKIKWDKLIKSLPSRRSVANDRAPTLDEIRKLAEYPDRRMKPLVYVTVSAGIRIRAWEHLRWKHVTPIRNDKGEIIAAKLIVYDDDYGDGQYITFMSSEAYHALKAWMDYRAQEGEEINGESYLMRDLWQTTNIPRGAIRSFAKNPRPWGFSGITKRLNTAWRAQGIRGFLPEGKTRHEFKQSHGLIKFHDTQTNTVMSPLYSELLRGHNIGLPGHYLRPTEQELLREYLKAVPLLTINEIDKSSLQEQVSELTERAQEAERTQKVLQDLSARQEEQDKVLSMIIPSLFNDKGEFRYHDEEGELKSSKDIYYKNKEGKFMSMREMYESMLKRVGTTEVTTEK